VNIKTPPEFLIVDDESDVCWALERIIGKGGFASRKAASGREALMRIKENDFKLIFLDAKLPDVDGLELAKRIKKISPRMPIVMVSGYFYRDDMTIERALKSGLICAFIGKPFVHSEILKIINAYETY
jgi:DNA-binding NtrC family response regulator